MLMRREDAEAAKSMSDSLGSSVLVHHHEGASPDNLPTLKMYLFSTTYIGVTVGA